MSSGVNTGYLQTDVGLIPIDWSVTRIDTDALIKTGSRNTQDRVDGGEYPFYVRSQQVESINSFSYDGEAVLTAGDGVGTGKVFHYINGKFDVHQRVYRISDFSNRLHGRYFFYQFSTRFYDRIMSMTAKSSVDSVRMEMIAGMQIPLPPIQEQCAIAAALDDIDALISSLDQLIAKKRDIQQAAMQQLLTGQRRLPGFTEAWGFRRLSELLVMPATYGVVTAGAFVSNGVPMLRGGDIKNSSISLESPHITKQKSEEYSRTILKEDDVIVALVGYPGEAARVPRELGGSNISRAVGLLRLNHGVLPDFLVCYLNSAMGRKSFLTPSAGSAQVVVNLKDLNALMIPTPDIAEQTAIATILSDMHVELAILEARRDKAHQIKQGMRQELLTGRIRLPQDN